ncbi:DUF4145 domain-containing protein [Sporosarcina luteola]|uniref:DUF4145 domain-containing protein n=1 Tax=Sporosarcina luteola TaxID=582850 RepID=UPI00203F12F8|nr:DUF4145 domain-containing protein [Sporosarcina luteola]MCM3743240.1 DUF4145 domain-containing protein [Sporosarcina luteola]
MKGKVREFSQEINEISLEFSKIYNQALEAERRGLDQIAGIGFRKSLEFLVKDYLINFKSKEKESIEGKLLGKCITEDVSDENVKEIAKRAVWLGNDETHYIRKWEGKDIKDLKILIDLTLYWIQSEILTNKLVANMN